MNIRIGDYVQIESPHGHHDPVVGLVIRQGSRRSGELLAKGQEEHPLVPYFVANVPQPNGGAQEIEFHPNYGVVVLAGPREKEAEPDEVEKPKGKKAKES